MGAGGKKAKAKDKSSKAATKQKNKKTKSPEATDDQTTTESPMPGSPELVVQDQEPVVDTVPEAALEPAAQSEQPEQLEHHERPSALDYLDEPAPQSEQPEQLEHLERPSALDYLDEPAPQSEQPEQLEHLERPSALDYLDEPAVQSELPEQTQQLEDIERASALAYLDDPAVNSELPEQPDKPEQSEQVEHFEQPSALDYLDEPAPEETPLPPSPPPQEEALGHAELEHTGIPTQPLESNPDQQLGVNNDTPETETPVSNAEESHEPIIAAEEEPLPKEESTIPVESQELEARPPTASTPNPSAASFTPFSPVPTQIPLPSPSLTEARFMSSPPPDNNYYYSGYSGSPALVPYVPQYAPQSPYASPYASPYGSPYASPYASPVPKVSSPLARSHYPYMPPAMSPTATPPPPPLAPSAPVARSSHSRASRAPSIAHSQSYSTAVHSPVMSTASVVSPYTHAPYPHYPPDGHSMQRTYSDTDPSPYAASFQAIRELGLGNARPTDNGGPSPPDSDAEHAELLHRIQSALPDINRLLHGFKSTHSKLSSREAEMKQIGNQHEQDLLHKDFYIEALQSQMKKTATESAEEGAKLKNIINELRMELGNLQEKQKDLEEGLAIHQKSNEELSQSKVELEDEVDKLNRTIQENQDAHAKEKKEQEEEHANALTTQKQDLTELFEEIKSEDEKAANETLEAREKELLDQHETRKGEWEAEKGQLNESLEAHRNDLEASNFDLAAKVSELESKENELQAQLGELTSVREEVAIKLTELAVKESQLEAKENELAEVRAKSADELEALKQGHAGELDSLHNNHEQQVAAAAKEFDDKIAAIEAHLNAKEQSWSEERVELEKLLSEKDSDLQSSEREKERLEGDCLIKEQQLQRAVDGMRTTIDHLGDDCDRLRKTLHSLGEATDLKTTKGDEFFQDCFAQLSQLIHELSKEHFSYLPIDPPKDILSKIPSELPSFLDNTPASRELRCAYVEHVVSKTITYRVFQPFLFTLGRRYDKADTFFQMLSMDIRRKSVRREAFWRQQTLKAAYTTSDAKQSINVAAAVIVDEIIDHIKHFADPKHLDTLLTGVRKIVKLAAETWRHARVERELVLASFPATDSESVSNDGWDEYGVPNESSTGAKGDPARHVVLRTFPSVLREAAHEDFASGERANPCIYSHGVLLYSDSPVVMARLQELAKKSTDTLVADEQYSPPKTPKGSRENLAFKGIERLATLTVQSAPTSPTPKGQFPN
ncbi:hypothetical protein N7466_011329 [Penicillium verhagenii]|uniref:uncharacterized protein n=1 Tax=Penicillium verhagenii TaxID=1562060 RepID=UPI002545A464|nr:uncharacterized protein N7466_011329 [Penicillium verhagenii]KAJ5915396.1 hypothetical protein N7466_011329 [Penicillium verhagenii]